MKRRTTVCGTISLALVSPLLFLGPEALAQDHGVIRLLKAQDYYGERAFDIHGGKWFGLYNVAGQWELRKSDVQVDTVSTPRGCVPTVTRVSVDQPGHPVFLLQGLPNATDGPVEVSFEGSEFLYPGKPLPLHLADAGPYLVSADGEPRGRPGNETFSDYRFVVEYSGQRQVLHEFESGVGAGPEGPQLVLAGDIDGDSRLDLILDLKRGYVGRLYTLFLSSLAENGQLVTKVAELRVQGC